MIMVKNSQYFLSLYFFSVEKTLVLSFGDVNFSKGCFLDDKNVILLDSRKFFIFFSKRLNHYSV